MKRLILSAILALMIHAAVLSLEGNWFRSNGELKSRKNPIRLSLVHISPSPPSPQKPPPAVRHEPRLERKSQPDRRIEKKIETGPAPKKKKPPRPKASEPPENRVKSPPRRRADVPVRTRPDSAFIQDHPDDFDTAEVPDDSPAMPQGKISEKAPEINPGHPETRQEAKKHPPSTNALPAAPDTISEAIPLYKTNPPPNYPRLAQRRGYEGTVVLNVFVNSKGRAEEVTVFKSSRYRILDKAAVSSVGSWLFEPGKKGDQKIGMWVKVPIRFELK